MSGILKQYRKYKDWKRVVWAPKAAKKVPLTAKISYALKGFREDEYLVYNFASNDYREYISEYERLKARDINGEYKFILDDKLIFEEVVGQYANVPRNYAWVNDGIVYGLHGSDLSNDNLLEHLAGYGKTVLKWNGRGGGDGTYVIAPTDDGFVVNDEPKSDDEVRSLFERKGNAILCQYITQSAFPASLYPHTTNTMRIVCAKKKGQARAEFIAAAQRVGSKASIPVDNLHKGGMTISIDPDTGVLGRAAAKVGKMANDGTTFDRHPDTGEVFTGRKVPDWDKIVTEMVELTNKLPYLNFVAWDILLTDDGISVIEGNASSGVGLFQMEHGIRDSKFGDVLKSYGIIS